MGRCVRHKTLRRITQSLLSIYNQVWAYFSTYRRDMSCFPIRSNHPYSCIDGIVGTAIFPTSNCNFMRPSRGVLVPFYSYCKMLRRECFFFFIIIIRPKPRAASRYCFREKPSFPRLLFPYLLSRRYN